MYGICADVYFVGCCVVCGLVCGIWAVVYVGFFSMWAVVYYVGSSMLFVFL